MILHYLYQLVVKGSRSKSVSFGVVLTHPDANKKQNSIISETSSVDLTDGNKLSSSLKRKSIIKLPYKKGDSEIENENQDSSTLNQTTIENDTKKDQNSENTAGDKIQAESTKTKKPAKVFQHIIVTTLVSFAWNLSHIFFKDSPVHLPLQNIFLSRTKSHLSHKKNFVHGQKVHFCL